MVSDHTWRLYHNYSAQTNLRFAFYANGKFWTFVNSWVRRKGKCEMSFCHFSSLLFTFAFMNNTKRRKFWWMFTTVNLNQNLNYVWTLWTTGIRNTIVSLENCIEKMNHKLVIKWLKYSFLESRCGLKSEIIFIINRHPQINVIRHRLSRRIPILGGKL